MNALSMLDTKTKSGLISRFNLRIKKTSSCWLWVGGITGNGYGNISFRVNGKRKTTSVHRLSYEIHIGEIPKGMLVCHKCDVRNCVNPDHLFVGTFLDNNRDRANKGRSSRIGITKRGENAHNVKLTAEQVLEIRRLRKLGKSLSYVAKMYLVTPSTISQISRRITWSHI